MNIVVDEQIPLVDELLTGHRVVKKPGLEICREDLRDAQMLWVRTQTQVNADLLRDTPVRFVGAATAGYDHLDTDWLEKHGIFWTNAPGANAIAVVEYVLMVIAALQSQNILTHGSLRAGVIGVGRVGSLVKEYLAQAGFQVLLNDPPRAEKEADFYSHSLEEFADLDLICIHPSLTRRGLYPSYHLLADEFFQNLKAGAVVLNAARGEVLATEVLLRQKHLYLCCDVWENEPDINAELLRRAIIATPHIAAYSVAAKKRASLMLYSRAQDFFGWPQRHSPIETAIKNLPNDWQKQALEIFDPLAYTAQMQEYLMAGSHIAEKFLDLRKNYPWRKSLLSLEG